MIGRACCGVRFLAGNLASKMLARKRKVLIEYLLFLALTCDSLSDLKN